MRYGFIYITVNKVNGMRYIGKCVYGRKNSWEKYLGSGLYLKRAIKKYGVDNFFRIIIDECDNETELREVEEYYIHMFNAVRSKEFYNVKYTSIGGDTFTHNPNKEETRKKRSYNSSGKRNPMYGKPKSELTIRRIKEANSRPCVADGVEYSSVTDASKYLGKGISSILYRIKSETDRFTDYYYLD